MHVPVGHTNWEDDLPIYACTCRWNPPRGWPYAGTCRSYPPRGWPTYLCRYLYICRSYPQRGWPTCRSYPLRGWPACWAGWPTGRWCCRYFPHQPLFMSGIWIPVQQFLAKLAGHMISITTTQKVTKTFKALYRCESLFNEWKMSFSTVIFPPRLAGHFAIRIEIFYHVSSNIFFIAI